MDRLIQALTPAKVEPSGRSEVTTPSQGVEHLIDTLTSQGSSSSPNEASISSNEYHTVEQIPKRRIIKLFYQLTQIPMKQQDLTLTQTPIEKYCQKYDLNDWAQVLQMNDFRTLEQCSLLTEVDLVEMYEEQLKANPESKLTNLAKSRGKRKAILSMGLMNKGQISNKSSKYDQLLLNPTFKFSGINYDYKEYVQLMTYVLDKYEEIAGGSIQQFIAMLTGINVQDANVVLKILKSALEDIALAQINAQCADPITLIRQFIRTYGSIDRHDKVRFLESLANDMPQVQQVPTFCHWLKEAEISCQIFETKITDMLLVMTLRQLQSRDYVLDQLLNAGTQDIEVDEIIRLLTKLEKTDKLVGTKNIYSTYKGNTNLKIDSAADCHLVNDQTKLTNVQKLRTQLQGIANCPLISDEQGELEFKALKLTEVRNCKNLKENLFSVLQAIESDTIQQVVLEKRNPRIVFMDRQQVKLEYNEGKGWYLPQNAKKYEYKRPTRYRGKDKTNNNKPTKDQDNGSDSE